MTRANKRGRDPEIWRGLKKRDRRWTVSVCVMVALALGLVAFMMIYGNTVYSPAVILRVLSGESIKGASYTIGTLRLPRMLAAVFAGFAFGMAGHIFQSVLRNSLASPDIIGVSSSTSAAAVFCILLLGMDGFAVPVIAVVTGIAVSLIIYLLAARGGFSHARMILIGIGVQAMVRALTSFVLSRTSEYDVAAAMRWMNGSLNSADMQDAGYLAAIVAAGVFILLFSARTLKILALGDEYSHTLGVAPRRAVPLLIGAAVLMVAFATAAVGPIASVAFLSGPVATRVSGRSRSGLLPSGLVGCILILAADMAGQYAFTARYPVGVVTGLLGAPYLLYLLITMNRKGETV